VEITISRKIIHPERLKVMGGAILNASIFILLLSLVVPLESILCNKKKVFRTGV